LASFFSLTTSFGFSYFTYYCGYGFASGFFSNTFGSTGFDSTDFGSTGFVSKDFGVVSDFLVSYSAGALSAF